MDTNAISLNNLLNLSDDDLKRTKIRFNRRAGNTNPIDVFKKDPDELDKWQFWNNKQFNAGEISIGLVEICRDQWLLFVVADILKVDSAKPKNTGIAATFSKKEEYKKYFGRVIVRYHNQSQQLHRWALNKTRRFIDELEVCEVLSNVYNGFAFPGYDKVRLTWQELESIIKGNYSEYQNALRSQKAVYLQTDLSTGKLYVGSATSDSGMLLARWKSYVENGHGGNEGLKALCNEKNFQYIKDNFQYTILENFNQNTPDEYVLARESYWKDVLASRKFGYNKN